MKEAILGDARAVLSSSCRLNLNFSRPDPAAAPWRPRCVGSNACTRRPDDRSPVAATSANAEQGQQAEAAGRGSESSLATRKLRKLDFWAGAPRFRFKLCPLACVCTVQWALVPSLVSPAAL